MEKTEPTQSELKGKQEIQERRWIENHGEPTPHEWSPGAIEWIPERHFSSPETLNKIEGIGQGDFAEVTKVKGVESQENIWKIGKQA